MKVMKDSRKHPTYSYIIYNRQIHGLMTYQILELEEHMLVPHDWCILVAGYVSHVFRVLFDTIDVDFENEINRPKQKQAITFKSFC